MSDRAAILFLVAAGLAGLAASCGGPRADAVEPRAEAVAGTLEPTSAPAAPPESPAAATVAVPRTERLTMESELNGVRYELSVALPRGAEEGGGPYPLLLLLDAHYSFLIARNVLDHMSERNDLPEVVAVGIGYPGRVDRAAASYRDNRTRDYTPTHVATGGYGPEHQRHSGGGPLFERVIAEEILPLLESRYRLDGHRALVGHSYGGLFATSVLLERPRLFDGIVAVSPSLWYDDHRIFDRVDLEAALREIDRPTRVYLGVGSREINEQRNMVTDLERFAGRLESVGAPMLEVRAQVLDDETHNSVFPRALSNGLRWIYRSR